ncbi:MAG: hypothetical protein WCL07_03445 [bacterium]
MTIHILHGDNIVTSRNKRQSLLQEYRNKGYEPRFIEGDKTTHAELESIITTVNMFEPDVILIDNLLGRLKSKEKDACLQVFSKSSLDKPIIMWDKRELTATMLKPIPNAKVEIFKESHSLFPFVDSLIPDNSAKSIVLLHSALKQNDIFLVFGMIVRRITDLIIAQDDPSLLTGSPWGVKQTINQSKSWTLPQLLLLHQQLLDIDLAVKTGNTKLDLTSQLDLLLLQL